MIHTLLTNGKVLFNINNAKKEKSVIVIPYKF